ncbi:MAG: hypothetical protein LWY06_20745 [Firmicutes bacterium]|nr:hypothetical protein [Bacillota bacterium]
MRKKLLSPLTAFIIALLAVVSVCNAWAKPVVDKNDDDDKLPEYKLLFFRNDNRVWILMPPKTTLVEVYRSDGYNKGYIRCVNSKGKTIAIDRSFKGDVVFSVASIKPSVYKNRFIASRYDGNAVAIYTPENARFIEVLNSTHGFDGVVTLMDRQKRILNRESGLDLQILDY